jgi:arginase
VGAAAGEALALVTGRGQAELAGIEGRRPYVRDPDVVLIGLRPTEEYPDGPAGRRVRRPAGAGAAGRGRGEDRPVGRAHLRDCAGFWVHVDVDVLDPA